MRKNYVSVLLFAVIILSAGSCKKNNDNPVTIEGKWLVKTEHFQVYTNNVLTEDTSYDVSGDVYFEFLKDGTLNEKDEEGNPYSYTYTYDNNTKKLTTLEEGISYEYDVKELTADNLILYGEETDTFEGVTSKYTEEVSCKRQ